MASAHGHCCDCINESCPVQEECPVVSCPECEAGVHQCKMEDHVALVCPEAKVPCVLALFGCTERIKRKDMLAHMEICEHHGEKSSFHQHCKYCMVPNSSCRATPNGRCCPLEPCPRCGVPIHPCQQEAHEKHLCLHAFIKCVNAVNGCRASVKRKDMAIHMKHCPASVIQCNFAYNRDWLSTPYLMKVKFRQRPADELLPDERFLRSDEDHATKNWCRADLSLYPLHRTLLLTDIQRYRLQGDKVALPSALFICGRFVRRDEWQDHIKNHQELDFELHLRLKRCPMFAYGCKYGVFTYHPSPVGARLRFHEDPDSFMVHFPNLGGPPSRIGDQGTELERTHEETEVAGYDFLGRLLPELLTKVLGYLDSVSLWCLSKVNHHFREACQAQLDKRGLVYKVWDYTEGYYRRWKTGNERWTFSRTHAKGERWVPVLEGVSIADHLKTCEVLASDQHQFKEDHYWDLEKGMYVHRNAVLFGDKRRNFLRELRPK